MAISTKSDFQLYDEQFYAGQVETLERNVNAFNEASNGAIQLYTRFHEGDFSKESFFKYSAHIFDRDPTNTSLRAATKLTMSELNKPKSNKGYIIEATEDSFRKIGRDSREMSYVLGQQLGVEMADKMLGSAISNLIGGFGVAAVAADLQTDVSGSSGITSIHLNTALSKMGDAAQRVRLWVMHSKVFFDLIGNQISEKLLEVTAGVLYGASPATFGRPVLVTDNPALFTPTGSSVASTDDVYQTFGLVEGAVSIRESEERSVLLERVGGHTNIIQRLQGEYAYTNELKGMTYSGAANPADSVLATSSNWAKAYQDKRSLMGVQLLTR